MTKTFAHISARAFCHATEDLDRVKAAMHNVVGDALLSVRRAEGSHGNPILIIESHQDGDEPANLFLQKMGQDDLSRILDSLESRLDEGCNLFVRLDKQKAFAGTCALATTGDVILVRLKVQAYPSKPEVAARLVREMLTKEISRRKGQA